MIRAPGFTKESQGASRATHSRVNEVDRGGHENRVLDLSMSLQNPEPLSQLLGSSPFISHGVRPFGRGTFDFRTVEKKKKHVSVADPIWWSYFYPQFFFHKQQKCLYLRFFQQPSWVHPGKFTWNPKMEVWLRWFSFSIRWFLRSMIIFRGVV